MGYQTLLIEKTGHVATLTLNRPDARNALDMTMRQEMLAALDEVEADETLRVLVGSWSRLREGDPESTSIDMGPRASGVFARFDASGDKLAVLDPSGHTARTLGARAGLIAATRAKDRQPVWFVTGTDEQGVESAARALDEGALANAYALAVSNDRGVAVPAAGRS
jgi:hypothetical protein